MGFVIRRGNKLVAKKRMCGGQARVQICVGNPCRSRRWVPPVGCTDHLWPPFHQGKEFQRQPFSARRKSSNEARAIGHHRRLQLTTTTSFPQQRLNQKTNKATPLLPRLSRLPTNSSHSKSPPPPRVPSNTAPHRAAKDGFPRCLLDGLRYVMTWEEKRRREARPGANPRLWPRRPHPHLAARPAANLALFPPRARLARLPRLRGRGRELRVLARRRRQVADGAAAREERRDPGEAGKEGGTRSRGGGTRSRGGGIKKGFLEIVRARETRGEQREKENRCLFSSSFECYNNVDSTIHSRGQHSGFNCRQRASIFFL